MSPALPTSSGHINVVDFPNDAFHHAGGAGNGTNSLLLRVPTTMVLDAAFAERPNVQNVRPFDECGRWNPGRHRGH
jgi:hypothetical protein